MSLSIFGFFFFRRNISSNIIIKLIIFHVCNQYTKLRVGWIVNSIQLFGSPISSWFKRFFTTQPLFAPILFECHMSLWIIKLVMLLLFSFSICENRQWWVFFSISFFIEWNVLFWFRLDLSFHCCGLCWCSCKCNCGTIAWHYKHSHLVKSHIGLEWERNSLYKGKNLEGSSRGKTQKRQCLLVVGLDPLLHLFSIIRLHMWWSSSNFVIVKVLQKQPKIKWEIKDAVQLSCFDSQWVRSGSSRFIGSGSNST